MASAFGPRLWKRLPPSVPAARSLGRRMTLHAAAALWHHYFVRDNTLALMWPPAGRGGRSSA